MGFLNQQSHRQVGGVLRRLNGNDERPARSVIHAAIFSPPFGGLYHYSSDDRDVQRPQLSGFFDNTTTSCRNSTRLLIPAGPSRFRIVGAVRQPGVDSFTDFPGDVIRAHQNDAGTSSAAM